MEMLRETRRKRTFATGERRGSIIDYVLRNEKTRERVKRLRVEKKVDSDHQPLTV